MICLLRLAMDRLAYTLRFLVCEDERRKGKEREWRRETADGGGRHQDEAQRGRPENESERKQGKRTKNSPSL
jgi:hypothetical protein